MPEEGVEPTRPFEQLRLKQPCLPFHHSGKRPANVQRGLYFECMSSVFRLYFECIRHIDRPVNVQRTHRGRGSRTLTGSPPPGFKPSASAISPRPVLVPETGVEPARSFPRCVLSAVRLPFHHSGVGRAERIRTSVLLLPKQAATAKLAHSPSSTPARSRTETSWLRTRHPDH